MSIRVKTSLCTRATILKDGETDGKATNRYLSCSASVLSLLEYSGPSADSYFDTGVAKTWNTGQLMPEINVKQALPRDRYQYYNVIVYK